MKQSHPSLTQYFILFVLTESLFISIVLLSLHLLYVLSRRSGYAKAKASERVLITYPVVPESMDAVLMLKDEMR